MSAQQNDFAWYPHRVVLRHAYQLDGRLAEFLTWLDGDEAKGFYRVLADRGIGRWVFFFEDGNTGLAAKMKFE